MLRCSQLGASLLFITLLDPLSQQSAAWRDPSPHTAQFVTVDKDVRLEVLDWGGSGRPVVLLVGGGNTAHVFDELAPKLTANCHVYGITRRGFGVSGFSALESGVDRLRDDVLAVIDALALKRPVLVGHSIAGAELSSVGTSHLDRVGGLVYLEAGYPYAFDNGNGPTMKEFQEISGPQPPTPGDRDFGQLQRPAEVGCTSVWRRSSARPGIDLRRTTWERSRFSGLASVYDDHDGQEEVYGYPGARACNLRDPPRSRDLDQQK